jgi:hypothetical protein
MDLQLCQRVEEKNRLLRQIAAAGSASSAVTAVDMSEVQERWDAFTTSLHQHDAHLEGQRGELQQQVLRQVEDFKGTIAGFASRSVTAAACIPEIPKSKKCTLMGA